MEPIIYYRKQSQIVIQAIMLVIAIVVGLWLVAIFRPHNYIAQYCFIGLGVFLLFLSAVGGYTLYKRLTSPKEILIINDEGIIDRSTGHGVPLIKWEDVKGIREEVVTIHKMVRVDIRNHEDYFGQAANAIKRRMLKNNMRMYGSPFVINARFIGTRHDALIEQVRFAFQEFKEKNSTEETV